MLDDTFDRVGAYVEHACALDAADRRVRAVLGARDGESTVRAAERVTGERVRHHVAMHAPAVARGPLPGDPRHCSLCAARALEAPHG